MSSFKRKDPSKQSNIRSYPGTRVSPASSSTTNTSTGITSLDDILGGGLPLSCSLVVASPDIHSSYGELVQKYYVAEGVASGHRVCVIDNYAEEFMQDVMWYPKSSSASNAETAGGASSPVKAGRGISGGDFKGDEEELPPEDRKVKIAWRYENMKTFQTTVSASSSVLLADVHSSGSSSPANLTFTLHDARYVRTSENYCRVFDLTSRMPKSVVDDSLRSQKLSLVATAGSSVTDNGAWSPTTTALQHIERVLQESNAVPVRVCIPSLGSPTSWGDVTAQSVLHFLHYLRTLLRKYPHGCASITLSPQLSSDSWGGNGWLQRVGWLTDASIKMTAFSVDPSLSAAFPAHHGFVHVFSLPCPSTLVAPSDRFSTLRGLASSASGFGGSGENNLAFKCTRKRLIFETLHLDLDGGVSERRTSAPSSTAVELTTATGASISAATGEKCNHEATGDHAHTSGIGSKVNIEFEDGAQDPPKLEFLKEVIVVDGTISAATRIPDKGAKKQKKKVAFFSERPDVYDF